VNNSNKKNLTKKRIAYHEAGHVAIGFYFNREIDYVTITPNKEEGAGGHVAFAVDERFRRKKMEAWT
jgi:ATP-dependent Zn protease